MWWWDYGIFYEHSDSIATSKGYIPNIIPVTDVDFLFFNYSYAISRLFHGFIELSDINYLDQGSENALLGLKLAF